MAKLTINGVKVTVDDSFLSMSPEQQDATVNEIAASLPKASAQPRGKALTFEEGNDLLRKEEMGGRWGELGAGLTSAVEGIPIAGPYLLGGAQKAAAGISSLFNGASYDDNLKAAKRITDTAQGENPIVSTVGQVAGGIAGTAPLIAAAPAAFGIGASSVPRAMIASGLSGGAIGGVDAAARSGGDLGEVAKGAGFGLGVGMAGPLVGNLAGRAYSSVMSNRATAEAAKAAGTSKPAVDVLARALAADNAANGVNANIKAAGSRAMLADAGPTTQATLDTAISRAGPGAGQASERIAARTAGSADDITRAMDAAFGPAEGMTAPLDALRTSSAPARAAAYDAAYAQPINYADPRGQALEGMVKSRVPASIIERANRLMRVNGEESKQILANMADDGTVTFERLPDVRQMDYIKRALDDVARSGDGAGALGGNTAEGRAYGNLARDIRNSVADLVPEYRTALDTAAEPIAQREAMLAGQRALNPSTTRDEIKTLVSGMSKAELAAMKTGVRSQVDEALANVTRAVSDGDMNAREGIAALRKLSSRSAREKIGMMLSGKELDDFMNSVDTAAKSFELRANLAANSKTYARQATDKAVSDATAPGFIDIAASGQPLATAKSVMQNLFNTGDKAHLARKDALFQEIADLLTRPAGQAGGSFLQAMQGAANRLPAIDRNAVLVGNAVNRGIAFSSPQARRLLEK